MLGATTAQLGGSANNTTDNSLSTHSSPKCSTCQVVLGGNQRLHANGPWHVYNIKRRIASLPPISFDIFQTEIQGKDLKEEAASKTESSASDNDDDEEDSHPSTPESASPFDCLFCSHSFSPDDAGLTENLIHMQKSHGTFIPSPETITDLQTFLGYLATEVRVWHECLYCGATKPSTLSVQSHMRDKQHCTLNLEREPELLDFWDRPPQGIIDTESLRTSKNSSDNEFRLNEKKLITSRQNSNPTGTKRPSSSSKRRPLTPPTKALPSSSTPSEESQQEHPRPPPARSQNTRQLARREELSIQGLSSHQRHALVLAEKKAQRSEDVARRAREWASAKGANTQKFDQLDSTKIGKRGKQDHRLMPR